MTLIKPTKDRGYTRFVAGVFMIVVAGGVFYISQYNALAGSRYEVSLLQERIAEAQVANAELKNVVYNIIDPTALEDFARDNGLVLEQHPEYLDINQWVSDSSY